MEDQEKMDLEDETCNIELLQLNDKVDEREIKYKINSYCRLNRITIDGMEIKEIKQFKDARNAEISFTDPEDAKLIFHAIKDQEIRFEDEQNQMKKKKKKKILQQQPNTESSDESENQFGNEQCKQVNDIEDINQIDQQKLTRKEKKKFQKKQKKNNKQMKRKDIKCDIQQKSECEESEEKEDEDIMLPIIVRYVRPFEIAVSKGEVQRQKKIKRQDKSDFELRREQLTRELDELKSLLPESDNELNEDDAKLIFHAIKDQEI
ncbi:MAG: hypothetical protein EZS28_014146, partial [Streblomastix strix]